MIVRSRPRCTPPIWAQAPAYALAVFGVVSCGKIPKPPGPLAAPQAPSVAVVRLAENPPLLQPPRRAAPRIEWQPELPGEGTLVVLSLVPDGLALPVFEADARARDQQVALARLAGGGYIGLVAVPLGVDQVPVEVDVTLIDGTRLTQRLVLMAESREFPTRRSTLRVAGRFTEPDASDLERIQREREILRQALSAVTPVPLWHGAFILPRDAATTSPYGQRRLFNNQLRSQHTGLDIRGGTGDPVYAANSGRVALARDLFYTGNAIYIDHGLGLFTGYFHLSQSEVSEGQWVEKGQLIGRVGATGRVTGPHLHWALYLQGAALDPSSLLDDEFTRISERLAAPNPLSAPE